MRRWDFWPHRPKLSTSAQLPSICTYSQARPHTREGAPASPLVLPGSETGVSACLAPQPFLEVVINIPTSAVFCHYSGRGSPQTPNYLPPTLSRDTSQEGQGLVGGGITDALPVNTGGSSKAGIGVPSTSVLPGAWGRGGREQGLHRAHSDLTAASAFPRKPWSPSLNFS